MNELTIDIINNLVMKLKDEAVSSLNIIIF